MHDLGSFPDARCTKARVFSLCGNHMPSEQVWDTRPVLGHVILSARLPLSREWCCRPSVRAQKPREWTVKKSRLVPGGGCSRPDGLLHKAQCQTALARCAWEGRAHQSPGESGSKQANPARGASGVLLLHHEQAAAPERQKIRLSFYLLSGERKKESFFSFYL